MAAGAVALAGCFGEDDDGDAENGDDSGDDSPGEDETSGDDDGDIGDEPAELTVPEPVDWTDESQATIEVGPGGEPTFEPDAVRVETGTTLRWVWMSDSHSLVPTHQPDGAGWEGIESTEPAGFEVEFVPDTSGEYRYVCEEHEEMVGYLVVE